MNRRHSVALLFLPCLLASSTANAGELEGSLIGSAAVSSRDDDGAVVSTGKIAFRADARLSVFALGLAGYAGVPRRVITGIGLGAQTGTRIGPFEPHVAAAVLRQHERNWDDAWDDPLGTAWGTGEDTARRTGTWLGAGVDLPLWRALGLELFATFEVSTSRFFDDRPDTEISLGAGFGARLDLRHAAFLQNER